MISIQNKKDFEAFFKLHYAALCNYANSYVKNKEEAEELVQDCFVKLWSQRNLLKAQVSLKAYTYKMVRNASLNLISHREVQKKYEDFQKLHLFEDDSDPNKEAYLKKRIQDAIHNMPDKRKEIFLMSRYEGLRYQEIAEELNISIKTVENHMGAALKQLRIELKDLSRYSFIIFFIEGLGEVIFSTVI